MRAFERLTGGLACGIGFMFIASCGGKGGCKDVEITMHPEEPLVIDVSTEERDAPWSQFSFSITNNCENPIYLVAIKYEATIFDKNGRQLDGDGAFEPGQMDVGTTDTHLGCKYTSFGTYPAGQTKQLYVPNNGPDPTCTDRNVMLIPEGLPFEKNKMAGFRYKIKVTPAGWFGTSTEQVERFDKFKVFYTR